MNNYEKIKAACQEANPELMKPSFGCKVAFENQILVIAGIDKGRYDCVEEWNDWKTHSYTLLKDEFNILGHEPQLSDVLMAINHVVDKISEGKSTFLELENFGVKVIRLKKGKEWRFKFVGIDQSAIAMPYKVGKAVLKSGLIFKLLKIYDLTKPVKDQSEECLNFLAGLL